MPTETKASKSPRDVTIVVLDELDQPAQAFGKCAFPRKGDLLCGYVVGFNRYPVVLCHVQRQSSPAAADLEYVLARTQAQFAAHMIQLCELCFFQAGARAVEIGAGIHHPLVKPEFVEIVADIVVMLNVAARPGDCVAPCVAERGKQIYPAHPIVAIRPDPVDSFEKSQQVSLDLDSSGCVQLAKIELRVADQFQQCAAVTNENARYRAAIAAGDPVPVPQLNLHWRIAYGAEHSRQ